MSDATTEPELAIEIVAASMGYALAKLSEDRTWLLTLDSSVGLETALRWDAEEFMKHRGRFIIADIEAAARRAGMEEAEGIARKEQRYGPQSPDLIRRSIGDAIRAAIDPKEQK